MRYNKSTMKKKSGIALFIFGILMLVVAGVLLWAVFNHEWLMDWWRGKDYQPVGEMGQIMKGLKLTDRGEFLFKASQPVLSSQDEFNAKCRPVMDEEMAVLGCYTDFNIYVYDIQSEELDGIKELTTAHELLHAVWARMNDEEKKALMGDLRTVYNSNVDKLRDEIEGYDESEQQEELYVRAGTEVKNLTSILEKHYGEVFSDQDLIVSYYDKYITVFKEIEAEMDELKAEMADIDAKIQELSSEYERRFNQLEADIVSFNACADVAGCFKSEESFYSRRRELLAEQNALNGIYEQINDLISDYNKKVEKYNSDVTRTEKLNAAINSSKKVNEL